MRTALTKIVPLSVGQSIPYWPVPGHHNITNYLPEGMFAEEEVSIDRSGRTLSLSVRRTSPWSRMTGERSTALRSSPTTMCGHALDRPVAWAERATRSDWFEIVERASLPGKRSVFGFPAPGDPYWDEQTWPTPTRYPRADRRLTARGPAAERMQPCGLCGDTPSWCAT